MDEKSECSAQNLLYAGMEITAYGNPTRDTVSELRVYEEQSGGLGVKHNVRSMLQIGRQCGSLSYSESKCRF